MLPSEREEMEWQERQRFAVPAEEYTYRLSVKGMAYSVVVPRLSQANEVRRAD